LDTDFGWAPAGMASARAKTLPIIQMRIMGDACLCSVEGCQKKSDQNSSLTAIWADQSWERGRLSGGEVEQSIERPTLY